MPDTIGEQLARNRARLFVGRTAEFERFELLLSDAHPSRVLFIHGPGGIGKSCLLSAFVDRAEGAGWPVAQCDARSAPPDPVVVRVLLESALAQTGADAEAARLLVIDTFECWSGIEGWLRDDFLPRQSSATRVVIAGRESPAMRWRLDPGWHEIFRHGVLPPLEDSDCYDYMVRRGFAREAATRAVEVARGHSLLLALIADADGLTRGIDAVPTPEDETLLGILVELVDEIAPPGEASLRRKALFASSLMRNVKADHLANVLEADPKVAGEILAWLRTLSFMEEDTAGVFPHDMMREALRSDLERRDPALRIDLLDRASELELRKMTNGRFFDPLAAADHLYLYENFMPPLYSKETEPSYREIARAGDASLLRAMVKRHEGERGVAVFDFYWKHAPQAFRTVRNAEGEATGFYLLLELSDVAAAWLAFDEQLALFWDERRNLARMPRDDEHGLLLRMWMHSDRHMEPSPVGPLWAVDIVGAMLLNPRIVMAAAITPDDADWLANNRLYGHRDIDPSRTRAGEQPVIMSIHDLSQETPEQWLRATYRRARNALLDPSPPAPPLAPDEVRSALRALHRPDRLASHPMLARVEASSGDGSIEILRGILFEEWRAIGDNPKTKTLHDVLDRSYFHPAVDQRAAAEATHLSWDQYRRRLTEAVKLLTARVDQRLRS